MGDRGARQPIVLGAVLAEDAVTPRAFRWIIGDVELRGGTWTSTAPLRLGFEGPARLVLSRGARLDAPEVVVDPEGELAGDGVSAGDVVNDGLVVPLGSGLVLHGQYEERLEGRVEGSAAPGRLAAMIPVAAGRR